MLVGFLEFFIFLFLFLVFMFDLYIVIGSGFLVVGESMFFRWNFNNMVDLLIVLIWWWIGRWRIVGFDLGMRVY